MSDNVVVFLLASLTVSAFWLALVSVSSPRVGVVAADAVAHGTVAHAFAPHITPPPKQELTHPTDICSHHRDMPRAHSNGKLLHRATNLRKVLAG